MNIIYKITYLPHLKNNTPPYYYIGSKFNYDYAYLGSPSSKQKDWFSGNETIAEWWKRESKQHPDKFLIEIVNRFDGLSALELVEEEKRIQIELDVRSSKDYFNKSIATSGWVSAPKTQQTKLIISEKTKNYWTTAEGQEKKKRLSERNKKSKSKEMLLKWADPEYKERLKLTGCWKGRPKGSVDKSKRIRHQRRVSKYEIVYESAKAASESYGLDPVSIRRKCRLNIEGWKYVD